MLQGASGRVREYDDKGKLKPNPVGKANTAELIDFAAHMAELRKRAGLPDVIQDKPTEPKSKGLEALNLLSKAFGGGGV